MEKEYIVTPDGGFISADELNHSGIKGMKWGIRRYQNKDGSLTSAGRKRYAKLQAEMKQLKPKQSASERKAEVEQKARKTVVSEMTDDELIERTNRMILEKNYYDAAKNLSTTNPVQVSKGKKFLKSLANDVLAPAAKNAGKEWVEKAMKDKLGLNNKTVDPIKKLENEYKTLELKQKIDRIKGKDKDDDLTWDERSKKQAYEWNEYLHERERRKHKKEDAGN